MLIMKMLTIGENLKHLHINTLFMSWTKKTSKTKKKIVTERATEELENNLLKIRSGYIFYTYSY